MHSHLIVQDYKQIDFSCLVLFHRDSSANGDHDSDKYDTCGDDDDDGDCDDDAGDDDEDSTLVKQSVSTAAAATGTEQHLESLIADLQQYVILLA